MSSVRPTTKNPVHCERGEERVKGVEPYTNPPKTPRNPQISSAAGSAQGSAHPSDPEFTRLAAAWKRLSAKQRRQLVALVESMATESPDDQLENSDDNAKPCH